MIRKRCKFLIPLLIASVTISSLVSINAAAADNNPPNAKFEISNVTPAINEAVTFDASTSSDAEGKIVSYTWDFKDGSTASGVTVTHSFAKIDDYNVKLTVKDASGNEDSKSKRIFIGRPEGWGEKSHSKSADADYKLLFPDDQVLRLDITMSSSDYQKINTDVSKLGMNSSKDPIYVPVTVKFKDKTWWNVGFRYKGNSSLFSVRTKRPFRLNFDEYEDQKPEINDQHFYGFSCMTFGNNWNDDSFMKEKVTSEIFRDGGVPAAKSSFCRVYIDTGSGAKYWGLYTMTEDVSDAMLKDQFGDDKGNCYKPEDNGADWTSPFRQDAFKKKNNEEAADWSDVKGAHTALFATNSNAAIWRANLEKYFNSRRFLRWLAINTAIVNWDCYGSMAHNYYLYQDVSKDGALVWITWDHNLSMTQDMMTRKTASLSLSEVTNKWPLIRKLMDDPYYKNIYHYEMQQAVRGCMNVDKITAKVKAYQAMIKPYIVGAEGETSDFAIFKGGESGFNSACNTIISHIGNRQTAVNTYLGTVSISPLPTDTPTTKPTEIPTATPTTEPTPIHAIEDVNHDGVINMLDIVLVAKAFNSAKGDSKYVAEYDMNNDTAINMLDIVFMAKKFNTVVKNS